MPILSFGGLSKKRPDKGAMLVYILIFIMILFAAALSGGSIALTTRTSSASPLPQVVNINNIVVNPLGQ